MQPSQALDMDNFFAYMESHLEKSTMFLKNIWLRGAIMITKKFKSLQRKRQGQVNRRWTFTKSVEDLGKDMTEDVSRSGHQPDVTLLQQYYYRCDL